MFAGEPIALNGNVTSHGCLGFDWAFTGSNGQIGADLGASLSGGQAFVHAGNEWLRGGGITGKGFTTLLG